MCAGVSACVYVCVTESVRVCLGGAVSHSPDLIPW